MTLAGGPLKFCELILEDNSHLRLWGGGLRFVAIDGVGIPPVRRLTERSALQHGLADRGFRLDARRMTLQLATDVQDEYQLYGLMDRIAGAFAPTDDPLKLLITRDDTEQRQIDCYVDGEIDFGLSQRTGTLQNITIPLLAPDPTWYYPTQQSSSTAITNGSASNVAIDVSGWTWEDWPIVTLTGPLDAGYTIYFYPIGGLLLFSSALPAGESIIIDCRPNYRSILRVSDNANKMGYLDPAYSIYFSSAKLVAPKVGSAALGSTVTSNSIYVLSAAGTTGASAMSVSWYKRYLSL